MIRSLTPYKVWLKQQTPAYRLAALRCYRGTRRRPSFYQARRFNALLIHLMTDADTPLHLGEKHH